MPTKKCRVCGERFTPWLSMQAECSDKCKREFIEQKRKEIEELGEFRNKPKTERQRLVEKADKAFSLFIRTRDHFRCYTCGATNATHVIQCGHLITRSKYAVRWDERNGRAQCAGCNQLHEYQPERYTQKWIDENGQAAYDKLVLDSNGGSKITNQDLKDIAAYYKQETKKILDAEIQF
jgi:hypothetical protein